MHLSGARMALAVVLLCSCGNPPDAAAKREGSTDPVAQAPDGGAAPVLDTPICEPDAPESPCPIVGRWQIAQVYNPDNIADPLANDRAMIGATLTVTANGDAPGIDQIGKGAATGISHRSDGLPGLSLLSRKGRQGVAGEGDLCTMSGDGLSRHGELLRVTLASAIAPEA